MDRAIVERVPGFRPWHVWILRDGLKYDGRYCKTRSECVRYMDVAGVPEERREWKR